MITAEAPTTPEQPRQSLFRRISKLLLIALCAEIGYAVLNIATMPVYLAGVPEGHSWIPNGRGLGEAIIGYVLVAFLLSEAVFKSPMGHLADRYGPKRLMLIGPCITVCTALLTLAVPHGAGAWEVIALILLRVLDGIGAAMLWPAAFSAVGDAVEDGERQQAMSMLNICYMLGIALAFPIEGVVNDLAHVRWAGLILAAVLFAFAALAVWKFIPSDTSHPLAHTEHSEIGIRDFLESMRQIPQYLTLAVITFAGIGFPMAIFKIFPIQEFGYSETQVGALIFPGAVVMAAASVPMSKFGERIGRIRAVHIGMALCACGLWAIASGAFVPALRQPWILAVGAVPVGIGFLLAIPAWMASVSDINPARRGVNLGAIMTAQGVGAIIGAPIGSTLYEKLQPLGVQLHLGADFGRYSPFVCCAACITIGWLVGLRILHEPGTPSAVR